MGKTIISALSYGWIIVFSHICVFAQGTGSCLDSVAAKVGIGSKVAVTDFSDNSISGKLLEVDLLRSTMTVRRSVSGRFSDTTITPAGLKEIKFYRNGKVQPLYCAAGLVVGGLIGTAIEEGRSSGLYFSAGDWFEDHYKGIVLGALAGGTLVAIFSLIIPSQGIINCRP